MVWKAAGEAGGVRLWECGWAVSARGKVSRKKTRVRATQKGFLPIPALHRREDGIGENPDSEYLRGLISNPQAGQGP